MFAVIKTGGKQYRVVANDEFEIERLPGEAGDSLTFTEVLMLGTTIGAPFVAGASVTAEIVEQTRGPKVISFKKRRRQNSKRTRGHRQDLTLIRIGEILGEGQTASEKPAKAAKVEKTEAEVAEDKAAAKAAKDEAKAAKAEAKAEAPTKKAPAKPRAKKTETVADAE
ncbi:hypothetical protein Sa4125_41400 [Aureimonas sp. SA4125]|uniref:50S ribosomal protein L21 n=1 Tax=Aureimonas sp. SA4125 TaxID=2826993 RepID=UPI001CC543FF|nr:50S ribosomal protein L21 [Aureimonas sp. SA4125]BDA86598.1 hypothetical protein Sa4125_41400 [Aureimonas sp. SA4125]